MASSDEERGENMSDRPGPYRSGEPTDGELAPTLAQCRQGYIRAANARETAKRQENEAWDRYVQDEIAARMRYLHDEEHAREKFQRSGKEMLGWRYLAQGCHGEDFSPARPWQTGLEMNWDKCLQLEDDYWQLNSIEGTLKAFRAALADQPEFEKELPWTEELEDLWRVYRMSRNGEDGK